MSISKILVSKLENTDLLRAASLVAGDWLNVAASGKTFDVTNPSTGEKVATLPDLGAEETRIAIDAAYSAQKAWAARTL